MTILQIIRRESDKLVICHYGRKALTFILEHDSDGGNYVVKVFIGGLGLEAIRLSEVPANLVLDAGLQAEIEIFDLVLAVEFAGWVVIDVISVVRYTETEHRTKSECPSVKMILGQDRDIQENKIIGVSSCLSRTEKVFCILADSADRLPHRCCAPISCPGSTH